MATSFVAGGDIQSSSVAGFDPTTLGGCVMWLDPSDPSVVFTDRARTTPAVNANVVNGILDKSGRANHVAATVASASSGGVPATGATLITDSTSGLGYLQFGTMVGTMTATTTGGQVFRGNTTLNGNTISGIQQSFATGINVSGPGILANTTINAFDPQVLMSASAGAGAGSGVITSTNTFTGNLNGTTAISSVVVTSGAIMIGMPVYGNGIVGNTFVTGYNSGTGVLTLSLAATRNATGVALSTVMQFNGTTTNGNNQITGISPIIPIGTMLFSTGNLPVNTYTTTALSGGSVTISTVAAGTSSSGTIQGTTNLATMTTPRNVVIGQSVYGSSLGGLEPLTFIYYIKHIVTQSGGSATVILASSNDANTVVTPITSSTTGQSVLTTIEQATYPFPNAATPLGQSNSTHFLVWKGRGGHPITIGTYNGGGFREIQVVSSNNNVRIGVTNNGLEANTGTLAANLQAQTALITGTFSESIVSGWYNGTPFATTNRDLQPSTSNVFNTGIGSGLIGSRANTFPAIGLLGEYVQFNRTLQNDERQQVEGYLAWKWGLVQYLPTTHPYYHLKAPQTSFLPTNAGNCSLWLDAADPTTITQPVSQWTDKSGSNNHATQTTVANQPTYLNNAVSFNGTTMNLPLTNPGFIANRNFTFFVVERRTSTKDSNYFLGGGGATQNSNLHIGYNNGYGANRPFVGFFSNDLINGTSVGSTLGITRIFKFNLTPTGRTIVLNGTLNTSDSTSDRLLSYPGGAIGGTSTIGFYQGNIQEMICYVSAGAPAATTLAQDQRVEGYLAWKWGLIGSLPGTHPFKTTQPGAFNPKDDISGCQLWLDAADNANVVRTVSQWSDKSGYGVHFTPSVATTPPSFTYDTYNRLRIANTTSATTYTMSSAAGGSGSTTSASVTIGSTTYTNVSLSAGSNTLTLSGAAVTTINQNETVTLNSGGGTVTIPADIVIAAASSGTTSVNQSLTSITSNYLNTRNDASAPFGAFAVATFNARSALAIIEDTVNSANFRLSAFNAYTVTAGGDASAVSSGQFFGRLSSARVILGMSFDPFQSSGSRIIPYINGTAYTAGGAGATLSYVNPLRLHSPSTAIPGTYSLDYHEVIVIAGGMVPAVREQLEGYLAWKWGLQSQLPSTHPYTMANYFFNNTRPFVRNFVPTDIEGCQLWMDAADRSVITTTNVETLVTQWTNKATNNHLTTVGGSPTYAIDNQAGRGVRFAGSAALGLQSDYMESANTISFTNGSTTIFVVASVPTNPNSTFQYIVGLASLDSALRTNFGTPTVIHRNQGMMSDGDTFFYNGNSVIRDNSNVVVGSAASRFMLNVTYNAVNTTDKLTLSSILNLGGGGVGNRALNGFINEVIVFSAAPTTSQRQQVEGYLAHKWGLVGGLPTDHPHISSPPSITPLTAGPTCIVWLDAADVSNVVTTNIGTAVTQWRDKSGNSFHANSSGTPLYRFAQKNISLTSNSGFTYIGSTAILPSGTSIAYTSFAVFSTPLSISSNGNGRVLTLWSGTLNDFTEPNGLMNILVLSNGTVQSQRGSSYPSISGTLSNSTTYIATTSSTFNGSFSVGVNGATSGSFFTSNSTATGNYADLTRYYIGRSSGDFERLNGMISEVLLYNTTLTLTERQQVEGYLAQKWGLQASLAAGHPYISTPSPLTDPRTLAGCRLWLDAADATTIITSNQTPATVVTSMKDKSGLANDITNPGSTITYATTLNNQQVLAFPSTGSILGNTLTTSSLTRDPANFSAFYVCRYPSSGSYPIQAIAAAFRPAVMTTLSAASNATTTVLTVASTTGFVVGNNVVITGSDVANLNQTGLITAIASATSMSVQLANGASPGAAATSGTVTQLRAAQFFGHDGTPYNVKYNNNDGGAHTVAYPFSQYPTTAPTALAGNTFLLSCVRQNGVYTVATNGVAYTFTGTATPFTFTGSPGMGITTTGGYSIFGGVQGMEIGEVLLYNSAMTDRERQQVEGYLAWKWGLQRATTSTNPRVASSGVQFPISTPVRHSYYNMPPYETTPMLPSLKLFKKTFDPADLSPTLWYDPQDASTITLDANNRITNWTSKGTSAAALTVPGAGFVGPLLTRSGTGTSINQQYADFASTVVSPISNVSVATFNPATVYGSACAVWLDAADASTITGTTSVTQWTNKGNAGGNFTVPAGFANPAYVTNDGRLGLQFTNTGTADTSSLMRSASNITLTTGTSNIFVVANVTNLGTGYVLSSRANTDVSLRSRGAASGGELGINDFFINQPQEQNGVSRALNAGTFTLAGYTVVAGVFGHSASRTEVLQLSSDFSNRFMAGFINEVIIINQSLTLLQRSQISSYLGAKWNISMTAPVNHGAVSVSNPNVSFSLPISSQVMTVTTSIPHNISVGRQLFFNPTTGSYAAGGRSLATSVGPFIVASANVNTSTSLQLTMSTAEAVHNVTTSTPIFLRVNSATYSGGADASGLTGVYTPTSVSGQVITITIPTTANTGAMTVIDMTVRNNTGTSGYYLAQTGTTGSTLNITPYSNQNAGTASSVNGIVEYGLVPFTSASYVYSASPAQLTVTFQTYEPHGIPTNQTVELNLSNRSQISHIGPTTTPSSGTPWSNINGSYTTQSTTTDNTIVVITNLPSGITADGRLFAVTSGGNGPPFPNTSYISLDNRSNRLNSYIIANVFNKCSLENLAIGTILNQNVSTIVTALQFTHNGPSRVNSANIFGASTPGTSAGSNTTTYALRAQMPEIANVDLRWNNTLNTSSNYINFVQGGGNFGLVSGVLNNVNSVTSGSDVPALTHGASVYGWRYNTEFRNSVFQSVKTSTASTLSVDRIRFGADVPTASSATVNSAFYDGGFGDFFVFNRILTLDERQLLEGWIAQKYRMQSGLGSTVTDSTTAGNRRFIHPYRLNPTTIIPSNTLDLASSTSTYTQNLVAWFDAANASSITFSSGAIVNGWSSTMGGLPVTLTPNGSAAPTLVQNAQNGLPGMRFAITGSNGTPLGMDTSATAMAKFSTINTNNEYTIITVYKQPTPGGSRVISNILGASSDPRLAAYTGVFSYRTAGGTEQTKNYSANVSGQTYIIAHYRRGNTLLTRVNGVLDGGAATTPANLAITGTNFGLHLGGYTRGSISTSPFAGDIYEHIIFRSALTDQEIQHLEGYLAWKWGVRTDAPLSTTYLRSYLDGFGTLALWLDASTLTGTNGSAVSAWTNLSGTSVAQTGSSNLPTLALNRINGRNAVQFNGTSQFVELNNIASLPTGNTSCTMFIVASTAAARTVGEGGPQMLFQYGGSAGPSGVGTRQMYVGVNNTPANIFLIADVQSAAARSSDTVAASQPFVMSATYNTTAGTGSSTNYTTNAWRNGTAFTTTNITSVNFTTTGTQIGYLGMGLNFTSQAWFLNGFICEVIVYSGVMAAAQRQLVESYLAWKWRAQGTNPGAIQLPTSHSYYNITP